MTSWIPIVASSAGAAVVTLFGAVTGGAIASRTQRRHWTRDKQVEACTAIVSESTRTQLALRRLWRHGEKVDWYGWNQALALISLVGTPKSIAAADKMDAVFWNSTSRMDEAGTFDEAIGPRSCNSWKQLGFRSSMRLGERSLALAWTWSVFQSQGQQRQRTFSILRKITSRISDRTSVISTRPGVHSRLWPRRSFSSARTVGGSAMRQLPCITAVQAHGVSALRLRVRRFAVTEHGGRYPAQATSPLPATS